VQQQDAPTGNRWLGKGKASSGLFLICLFGTLFAFFIRKHEESVCTLPFALPVHPA
jgi:hypothetical protein